MGNVSGQVIEEGEAGEEVSVLVTTKTSPAEKAEKEPDIWTIIQTAVGMGLMHPDTRFERWHGKAQVAKDILQKAVDGEAEIDEIPELKTPDDMPAVEKDENGTLRAVVVQRAVVAEEDHCVCMAMRTFALLSQSLTCDSAEESIQYKATRVRAYRGNQQHLSCRPCASCMWSTNHNLPPSLERLKRRRRREHQRRTRTSQIWGIPTFAEPFRRL